MGRAISRLCIPHFTNSLLKNILYITAIRVDQNASSPLWTGDYFTLQSWLRGRYLDVVKHNAFCVEYHSSSATRRDNDYPARVTV